MTTSAPRRGSPSRGVSLTLAAALVLGLGAAGAALGRTLATPQPAAAAVQTATTVPVLPTEEIGVLAPVGSGAQPPQDAGWGRIVGTQAAVAQEAVAAPVASSVDLEAAPAAAPEAARAALGPVPDGEVVVPAATVTPPAVTPSAGTTPAGTDEADGTDDAPGAPGGTDDTGTTDGTDESDPADLGSPGGPDLLPLAEPEAADPCAPTSGDPAAECPDGVRSTVLALTEPPSLTTWLTVDPPRWDPADGGVPPIASCPSDMSVPAGAVLVAVASTAPLDDATLVISSQVLPDPPVEHQRHETRTPAARTETWLTDLAAGRPFAERWQNVSHCVVLDGLEAGVSYVARADVTDVLGRSHSTVGRVGLPAESRPALITPPTRVVPISTTRLFATVAHRSTEAVDVRGWVAEAGAEATCDAPAGAEALFTTAPETHEVDAADAERRGHDPEVDLRTNQVIGAPPGSTVVVCIRWYPVVSPSWDRDRPARAAAVVLDTPDLLVPVVTLAEVDPTRTLRARALQVGVSFGGAGCGTWTGPAVDAPDRDATPATVVCDPRENLAWTSLGVDRDARVDVVLRADGPGGSETGRAAAVLRTAARPCGTGCTVPEPTWFRLPLPAQRMSSGLCGGSGDCTPPTEETTAGSLLLRVDWVRTGTGTGHDRWSRSDLVDVTQPPAPSDAARLDVFQRPTVTGPDHVRQVTVPLRADRPVTWAVRWVGCTRSGDPSTVEITEPTASASVTLHDVCAGAEGGVEVSITDAAGTTQTWGPSREVYGDAYFYAYGYLWVPGIVTTTDVVLTTFPPPGVSVVETVSVTLGGQVVPWRVAPPACLSASETGRVDRVGWTTELPDRVRVVVTVALRAAGAYSGSGPDRSCAAEPGGPTQVVSFTTTLDRSALRGDGVLLERTPDDGAPFGVRLQLAGS